MYMYIVLKIKFSLKYTHFRENRNKCLKLTNLYVGVLGNSQDNHKPTQQN